MIPFFLRTIGNYKNREWRNNNTNCTDPQKLFEAIVFKPEDVIKKFDISYWSTNKSQSYNYLLLFKPTASTRPGRCPVPVDESV